MNYAIIKTGGRQFRVAEGDTIDVDILDVEPGKTATFGDVLLFADGDKVTHGDPLISGAKVTAEVLEQRKDKKVIAFKYKRRKGYHRTVGHRRKLTRVKIKSINVGEKKTAPKKTEEWNRAAVLNHQLSTKNSLQWLTKKDKAALRMAATASASGWV